MRQQSLLSSAEEARHAKLYDRKVKGSPLTVGDRVLLANRGERGKRKVAEKWESDPYEVLSVRSAINFYRVKDSHWQRKNSSPELAPSCQFPVGIL